MIDYLIVSLPRSGSAWLSAFLSTDDVPCIHEATSIKSLDEWMESDEHVGICDTSLFLNPDKINKLDVPKIVVYRDHSEIIESLNSIDLEMDVSLFLLLDQVKGMRLDYEAIFKRFHLFKYVVHHTTGKLISEQRWNVFREMNIQNAYQIHMTQQFVKQHAEFNSARMH